MSQDQNVLSPNMINDNFTRDQVGPVRLNILILYNENTFILYYFVTNIFRLRTSAKQNENYILVEQNDLCQGK